MDKRRPLTPGCVFHKLAEGNKLLLAVGRRCRRGVLAPSRRRSALTMLRELLDTIDEFIRESIDGDRWPLLLDASPPCATRRSCGSTRVPSPAVPVL
ncbi:MAG: hypothetical protein U0Q07_15160 [Acidimicrobiales bacterium]